MSHSRLVILSLVILTTARSFFHHFVVIPFYSVAFSVNNIVSVFASARLLTRLDLRVGLCPTLLYPEDPEMPETTKVTRRPLQPTWSFFK